MMSGIEGRGLESLKQGLSNATLALFTTIDASRFAAGETSLVQTLRSVRRDALRKGDSGIAAGQARVKRRPPAQGCAAEHLRYEMAAIESGRPCVSQRLLKDSRARIRSHACELLRVRSLASDRATQVRCDPIAPDCLLMARRHVFGSMPLAACHQKHRFGGMSERAARRTRTR